MAWVVESLATPTGELDQEAGSLPQHDPALAIANVSFSSINESLQQPCEDQTKQQPRATCSLRVTNGSSSAFGG